MKKTLIPLTALAILALMACGTGTSSTQSSTPAPADSSATPAASSTTPSASDPAPSSPSASDPTPSSSSVADVYEVAITNKADLQADWKVGGDNRDISLSVKKNGSPLNVQVLMNEDEIEVTSSNTSAVIVNGLILKAIGGGEVTVTVTAFGVSDSFKVTVSEPQSYTIAGINKADMDAKEVTLKGIVTTVVNGGFMLDDGTGAVLVFTALPDGVAKGDYVKVCGKTSFYHSTICEIGKGAAVIKLNAADAPTSLIKDTVTPLTGEGYAAKVADVVKGEAAADIAKIPSEWNLKFQYVSLTSTMYLDGSYYCFKPDDAEAKWPLEALNYSKDITGVELKENTTYDITGYLAWDAKYGYGGLYVDTIAVTPTKVESIKLSAPTNKVYIQGDYKGTLQIAYELTGLSLADAVLTWDSTNKAVATVDNEGLVTAVAAGEASITCAWGNLIEKIDISVVAATDTVTDLDLAETATDTVGHKIQLAATVTGTGDDCIKDVVWASDNKEVATVDDKGVVTLLSAGEANITATTIGVTAGGTALTATCKVTATALSYGTAEAPLGIAQLLNDADLIVALDPDNYVYSEQMVTAKGVVTAASYSTKYENWNLTLADEKDNTKTIKVTGAVLDENIKTVAIGDAIVIKHYLEASKTYWTFYQSNKLDVQYPLVLGRTIGKGSVTISAENATVTGITEGEYDNDTELVFTVAADEGYKIDAVKANGVAVTPDNEGKYKAIVAGATAITVDTSAEGAQTTKVTADFTAKAANHNNYGDTWNYTDDYELAGAANSNGGWAFVKFGPKSATLSGATYPGTYLKTLKANPNAVSSVDINLVGKCYNQDNESAKIHIEAYSDAAMTTKIGESAVQDVPALPNDSDTKTLTFVPSVGTEWAANSYYKVVIDVVNTTTYNGVIAVASIDFVSTVIPA